MDSECEQDVLWDLPVKAGKHYHTSTDSLTKTRSRTMKYSKSPLHISDTQMHSTHSFSLKVEHNGQCKHNFVHKKNAPGTFNPNLQRKKKYQTCYNSFLTGYGTVSIYILQLLILHRHKKKHCLIAAFKKETSYLKYAASVFHVLPKHL